MLDLPPPFSPDRPRPELVDAVHDTLTVSKIPRAGRAKDRDSLRLTLRPVPAGTAAPTCTSVVDAQPLTLTFTASRNPAVDL